MTGVLLMLVFVPMLIEARRSSKNERIQRDRGGIEPRGDVYKMMQVAYPGAFVAMVAERARQGGPPAELVVAGLAVFMTAKALKWWAIASLDSFWTFRVIVVPGACLIARGPYTHLRHPNYLAVVGELAGVALMAGARVSGPIAILAFGLLIVKRINVEERAMKHFA